MQRETYGNANGYIFDPKEVFQGEGGSIGGRGGGEGDGTTMGSDNHAQCDAVRGSFSHDRYDWRHRWREKVG